MRRAIEWIGNGSPWWVKAILALGFPVVLVIYFLARDAGYVPSPIIEARDVIVAHAKEATGYFEKSEDRDNAQTRLLRAICRNTAKTDVGRDACEN